MSSLRIVAAGAVAAAVLAGPAGAQNQLSVICPVQAEWCNAAAVAFEKETGVKVAMTLKEGDKVLYQKYSGTEFKLDGEELLVISQDDVLALIEG